jgi:acetyltransferase
MASSLSPFFEPRGVAIIGASSSPDKLSFGIVKNMTLYGYRGKIYPVNPNASEILGLNCYQDISLVPDPIDLAVVVLPAALIPGTLKSCGDRGLRAVTIISGGFKEIGMEGKALENEIVKIASQYAIRLIGPNCVGTMNLVTGLNTTFIKGIPAVGGIGFISQSGAVCGGVVDHVINEGVGFSHFLSLGNEADVDETDMIEFLGSDPNTHVIAAYIEGIQDGQKFLKMTRKVAKGKPVVILKAGRSEEGAKAVSSHTGSLAGSHSAYQAAFKQGGALEVFSTTDLLNVSMALDWLELPNGNRVAIVTNSGGPAALASDSLSAHGLQLASIAPETQKRMKLKLNPAAQTANPVDMLGGATEIEYAHALQHVLKDDGVDMALAILVPQALVNPALVANAIVEAAKSTKKPVMACMMGNVSIREARKILNEHRVPVVDYPELVGVMLGSLHRQSEKEFFDKSPTEFNTEILKTRAFEIFKNSKGKKHWGESNTRKVLEAYEFPLVSGGLAATPEEALKLAEEMGFPVVMKAASDDILHKSDAGVIKVGIKDSDELLTAYKSIMNNAKSYDPNARIEGMLIEKFSQKGEEVIIGIKRDPGFGPLVMFGMGGIYVELFKDVAFRVAPLTHEDAESMVKETKAFTLLNGWRGGSVYDLDAIYDAIIRLSRLAEDFPQIEEIEINPLRIFPKGQGAVALDCRMILD